MRITLLAIPFALIFAGCATTPGPNFENTTKFTDRVKTDAKFGTLSKSTRKKLGLDTDDGIVAVISNGNVVFYGAEGKGFSQNNRKPEGQVKRTIKINVWVNSPECEEIDDGSGWTFWYPWDCPHPH